MACLRKNFTLLNQYRNYLKTQKTCSGATLKVYEAYDSLILDWAEEQPLSKAQNCGRAAESAGLCVLGKLHRPVRGK